MHYSGGLKTKLADGLTRTVFPGWPVCCSGDAARKAKYEGRCTTNMAEVTCATCQRWIVRSAENEINPRLS